MLLSLAYSQRDQHESRLENWLYIPVFALESDTVAVYDHIGPPVTNVYAV